ncbi:glial cell line-derived neurotrophic factor-like [Lampris incognitus]|uniref:glial cell line-derived neurotrophic factor-like n=1 Tax=Lampris incognitus TaxID=2546036 RepID=UPI0024B5042C|nr:glial cell line-derived neurotrophic factor-like [Lampris incognitus]
MKLWDSLTTCFILLSAVHANPLLRVRASESPPDSPPVRTSGSVSAAADTPHVKTDDQEATSAEEQYDIEEVLPEHFENVVDFIKVTISRIRRSSSSVLSSSSSSSKINLDSKTRHKRERKKLVSQRGRGGGAKREQKGRKGRREGGSTSGGRGQGCMLKQIHLNVSDLGLGYRSDEEMIFRYCSGPCRKSETNYDKILNNLTQSRKIFSKDTPPHACCRPIAFDDDLSFLDNNLIYHTVRKHSARKCGCV